MGNAPSHYAGRDTLRSRHPLHLALSVSEWHPGCPPPEDEKDSGVLKSTPRARRREIDLTTGSLLD